MKRVLQIDPEFKRLSVPLAPEEERRLENSLIQEGCREPIAVWHGCILDGHKRYEICSYEEIEFEVREMDFPSREEAIIWVCSRRVENLGLPHPIYKYLVGKWYNAEKELAHQKRKKEKRKTLDLEIETKDETGQTVSIPVSRVSFVVAHKTSRTRNAIEKYGSLSKLYERIAENDIALFDAIMSERISITFVRIQELAGMDSTRLANVRRRLLHEKDIKMRQHMPRPKEEKKPEQILAAPLEVGIKEMPAFDPDMEFRGLMLTIPTWINAISRTRGRSNIEMVSDSTREQLANTLRSLEKEIMQTLEVIEQ